MDYNILATSFTNFDNDTFISCGEVVQIIADLDPFEEDEAFSISITSAMFGDTMLRVGSRFMENYTIDNPPGNNYHALGVNGLLLVYVMYGMNWKMLYCALIAVVNVSLSIPGQASNISVPENTTEPIEVEVTVTTEGLASFDPPLEVTFELEFGGSDTTGIFPSLMSILYLHAHNLFSAP